VIVWKNIEKEEPFSEKKISLKKDEA